MAGVRLSHVFKTFGKVTAVNDFSLDIEDGEFVILVGPSGCGKTTVLRAIAGIEEPTSGEIHIGERLVNQIAPSERDIAMVFQNYALYPHMDVYRNMAFCLQLRKLPKPEIEAKVRAAADFLGLTDYLHRKPRELSGGQRQRVALGRAVVRSPKVFLFDEPLSNLDAKLRTTMRAELLALHQRLKTTSVYVTHDQMEAMTMGDRIVVIKGGTIQQEGAPQDVYDHPANQFVAGFIGSPAMNFISCEVTGGGEGLYAEAPGIRLRLPAGKSAKALAYKGKKAILGVRPEHLFEAVPGSGRDPEATFSAAVWVVELLGSEKLVHVRSGDNTLVARLEPGVSLRAGDTASLFARMECCHLFDAETGATAF